MPSLVVMGATSLHQTFHAGFAFLKTETVDDYKWALRQMQSLYQDFSVQHLRIIVTDRDLGMLEAIRQVFPPS